MTSPVVLDSSALLAVFFREPGGDVVLDHIDESGEGAFIHAVNAFEVVSKLRFRGLVEENAWDAMRHGRINRIEEADENFLRCALRVKYSAPSLSLGDCFCIAQAESMGGLCLTSDKGFLNADTSAEIKLFRT